MIMILYHWKHYESHYLKLQKKQKTKQLKLLLNQKGLQINLSKQQQKNKVENIDDCSLK